MPEQSNARLIRDNAIVADEWTLVELPAVETAARKQAGKVVQFHLTGETTHSAEQIAAVIVPPQGKVLIPLGVWLARRETLAERLESGEIGVWLGTHESPQTLIDSIDDINRLPLIAVQITRFIDGRAFSIGHLLRSRHGYRNALRAFGDVLRDQMFFFKRCGYDSYLVRADRSAEEALAGLQDFSEPYQGAIDQPLPVWRRREREAP